MKNIITTKLLNQIGLSLTIVTGIGLATVRDAAAASFNLGGFNVDSANFVTGGSIIPGSQNVFGFDAMLSPELSPLGSQTVGAILGLGTNNSVNLGNETQQGALELNWGQGMALKNQNGNDLVVYENGSPEAYAIAVRKVGQSQFSQFLYKFNNGFAGNGFVTAFDLSDFGLGFGEKIDAIRIRNFINGEGVSESVGQGFLGGSFLPRVSSGGEGFDSDKFDPDITFVAGLSAPTDVPEPGSILGLLAFGACGVGAMLKRKQQRLN